MTAIRVEGGEACAQCALELEALLVVTDSAREQAQPDETVADDHHGGEHGVARQARFVALSAHHDRDDQGHLDDGDRQRENEGSEWLADPERNDLGMVDGAEHGCDQHRPCRDGKRRRQAEKDRCDQNRDGEHRPGPGPPGRASVRCSCHPAPSPSRQPENRTDVFDSRIESDLK
jgi:hypothetical protein